MLLRSLTPQSHSSCSHSNQWQADEGLVFSFSALFGPVSVPSLETCQLMPNFLSCWPPNMLLLGMDGFRHGLAAMG